MLRQVPDLDKLQQWVTLPLASRWVWSMGSIIRDRGRRVSLGYLLPRLSLRVAASWLHIPIKSHSAHHPKVLVTVPSLPPSVLKVVTVSLSSWIYYADLRVQIIPCEFPIPYPCFCKESLTSSYSIWLCHQFPAGTSTFTHTKILTAHWEQKNKNKNKMLQPHTSLKYSNLIWHLFDTRNLTLVLNNCPDLGSHGFLFRSMASVASLSYSKMDAMVTESREFLYGRAPQDTGERILLHLSISFLIMKWQDWPKPHLTPLTLLYFINQCDLRVQDLFFYSCRLPTTSEHILCL